MSESPLLDRNLDPDDSRAFAGAIAERFFSLSIDMLCVLGFDGYFRRLSPAWERVLGYTLPELKSRPFIEFVHPDDRDRTLKQNRDVRGGTGPVVREPLPLQGWLVSMVSLERDARSRRANHLLRGPRHHRTQGGRGRARASHERTADGPRGGENPSRHSADLLVLPEDPRRRKLLALRRSVLPPAHGYAIQPRGLPGLLHATYGTHAPPTALSAGVARSPQPVERDSERQRRRNRGFRRRCNLLKIKERAMGLEPTTSSLGSRDSLLRQIAIPATHNDFEERP